MGEVNIVNNGKPYFFRFDIAKEGGMSARITDYLKTRVNDNGKKVPVKWFDQGVVMNVHGMSPFIQGGVGHYTPDENNELLPGPDVVYRDWQGTPADVTDDGMVYYTLEDQFFCKQGQFKGIFGLRDSNGNVFSSVNIIFEIQGNDFRIHQTTEYYSSELEKMKAKFANDTDQAVKDFNAKIEAETENNRTALNALSASIQANRDGQASIAEQQAAITRQIKDQDIVTKTDYDNNIKTISESINERLAQMKTAPVGVADAQTLRNTYPNGADGIFLALDTKHIWMWLNGQWTDGGVYQSAGLDKAVQQSIGDTKSILLKENLIQNGSFADGNTAPAWGNSGNESLSLFDFLNRTWLNVSSSSQAPYQGVAWTFKNPALTSGIMYPLHIEFDLITQDSMKLSLAIIGIDADGNRIGGSSEGVVVDTISTKIWQMKHESIDFEFPPSLASASSITIQLIQPDSKAISTLRITGLSSHFVLPENNRELTGNLIDNNLLEKGINNNASVNVSGDIFIYKNLA